MGHFLVDLGLMLPYPDDLGGSKARQDGVSRQLQDPLGPYLVGDPVTLRASALVIPHDARPQNRAIFVQKDQTMHLPGEANARHLVGIGFALSQHPPDALHSGLPPVFWILLRPLRVGGVHRVFGNGAGDHLTGLVDEERLGPGRAHIEPHQVDQFAFLP